MITGTVPVEVPEKLSDLELDAGGKKIDNLGLGDTLDDVMRRSEKTGDYGVYGLIQTGLAADRPAPGVVDRFYFSTDTLVLERDTGAAWVEVVRGEAAIRLVQLAERAHSSLTDIGADDHHTKYTDVEAQAQAAALIALHALIAAAHHAAFTPADHTAIGDAAPHHVRYADAEAQATVKANVEVGDLKAPTKPLAMNNQNISGIADLTASKVYATTEMYIPAEP